MRAPHWAVRAKNAGESLQLYDKRLIRQHTNADLSHGQPPGANVHHILHPTNFAAWPYRVRGLIRSLNGAALRTWGRQPSTSPVRRLTGSMPGAGVAVI
jgi:hypothetical protein